MIKGKDKRGRLVVLISGNGSNLQALINACADGQLPANIVAVISHNPKAYGLQRAKRAGLPTCLVTKQPEESRTAYDQRLAHYVATFRPDWIVLAGWLQLLSTAFLHRFPKSVLNLHPALPGCFPGLRAIERAFASAQQGKITHTGVMVHEVPDEGVDCGPVLAQSRVPILPSDTLASLSARIHVVERRLLIDALKACLTNKPD